MSFEVVAQAFVEVPWVRLHANLFYRTVRDEEYLPRRDFAIFRHVTKRWTPTATELAAVDEGCTRSFGEAGSFIRETSSCPKEEVQIDATSISAATLNAVVVFIERVISFLFD
ncbi:hypothetical protein [Crateriforma conspicua]|uniref:hypothetical protein n=1 Tax=Crateriforma TaxID=2714592 RepID=UPI0018CE8A38|nr:hypothetical protein [Crateriforma conspicua]